MQSQGIFCFMAFHCFFKRLCFMEGFLLFTIYVTAEWSLFQTVKWERIPRIIRVQYVLNALFVRVTSLRWAEIDSDDSWSEDTLTNLLTELNFHVGSESRTSNVPLLPTWYLPSTAPLPSWVTAISSVVFSLAISNSALVLLLGNTVRLSPSKSCCSLASSACIASVYQKRWSVLSTHWSSAEYSAKAPSSRVEVSWLLTLVDPDFGVFFLRLFLRWFPLVSGRRNKMLPLAEPSYIVIR